MLEMSEHGFAKPYGFCPVCGNVMRSHNDSHLFCANIPCRFETTKRAHSMYCKGEMEVRLVKRDEVK